MPLISSSQPTFVRYGFAIYGVAHEVQHAKLNEGFPVQDWWINRCCLTYPTYIPTLRDAYNDLFRDYDWLHETAEKFPGKTVLMLNEPDVWNQADVGPRTAMEIIRKWREAVQPYWRMAGFGVTVVDKNHPLVSYTGGWRNWLNNFLQWGGELPDLWHFHNYALTVDAFKDHQDQWWEWWGANGAGLPCILSEFGVGQAVRDYVRSLIEPRLEMALEFTNFADPTISGIQPTDIP